MKLQVASLVLSAVSVAGMLVAVFEARGASSEVRGLSDRVAKMESATPLPAVAPAGPSNADLAREIAAIRAQVSSLASLPPASGTDPAAKSPEGASTAESAAKEAIEDEERRQMSWLDEMCRSIVEHLTDQLELSAQQTSQVSELVGVQVKNWRKARAGQAGDDTMAALEALKADTNEKMMPLLTAEQKIQYEEIAKRPGGIFSVPASGTESRHVERSNGAAIQPK